MYTTTMFFGLHPATYFVSFVLGFAFRWLELRRIAIEKHRRHRKIQEFKKKNTTKTEERRIRLLLVRMKQIRSLNAEMSKLTTRTETLEEEGHKKDIQIIELLMKNTEFNKMIEKYENREAFMEAVGLIPPKKNA